MAHLLIVDDDEDIRFSMRALLEDVAGHTVQEAVDGVDGLEKLQASEVALVVLLDLLMPRLDGFAVLEAVSADQRLVAQHVYIVDSVSRRATDATLPPNVTVPVQILSKPFDIDDILDAVAQAERRLAPPPDRDFRPRS